ncbi:MAG TPA: lasso peptide biosynthesis B2 protein [Longimicrobiales bacterium]
MISPRPFLAGAMAALAAPRHLGGERLKRLLEADAAGELRPGERAAVRTAHRALRVLSRLPLSPWRNTCLYRSVAGCLAVRRLGGAATLRLGARRDPETGEVVAHAWLEGYPDEPAPGAGYRVLGTGASG